MGGVVTILGAKHYFAEVDHLGSILGTPSSFFSLAFLSGFCELSSFALLHASCMILLLLLFCRRPKKQWKQPAMD